MLNNFVVNSLSTPALLQSFKILSCCLASLVGSHLEVLNGLRLVAYMPVAYASCIVSLGRVACLVELAQSVSPFVGIYVGAGGISLASTVENGRTMQVMT